MKQSVKTLLLWGVLIAVFAAISFTTAPTRGSTSWEEVISAIELGGLDYVEVTSGNDAIAHWRDRKQDTIGYAGPQQLADVINAGGAVVYERGMSWIGFALSAVFSAFLSLLVIFWWMRVSMKPSKQIDPKEFAVPAKAIATAPALHGLDEAKATLKDAVNGGPRVLLLSGPGGSGKTSLVHWLAAESKRPLFVKSGAEFMQAFVGIGAARMRRVFEVAAAAGPCIVAIEDVEAFAIDRVHLSDDQRKTDEPSQTTLQLKDLLDGSTKLPENIVFIATTARADLLDPLFTRRFTRIELPQRSS